MNQMGNNPMMNPMNMNQMGNNPMMNQMGNNLMMNQMGNNLMMNQMDNNPMNMNPMDQMMMNQKMIMDQMMMMNQMAMINPPMPLNPMMMQMNEQPIMNDTQKQVEEFIINLHSNIQPRKKYIFNSLLSNFNMHQIQVHKCSMSLYKHIRMVDHPVLTGYYLAFLDHYPIVLSPIFYGC